MGRGEGGPRLFDHAPRAPPAGAYRRRRDLVPGPQPPRRERRRHSRRAADVGSAPVSPGRRSPEEARGADEQSPRPRDLDDLPGADVLVEPRPPGRVPGRRGADVPAPTGDLRPSALAPRPHRGGPRSLPTGGGLRRSLGAGAPRGRVLRALPAATGEEPCPDRAVRVSDRRADRASPAPRGPSTSRGRLVAPVPEAPRCDGRDPLRPGGGATLTALLGPTRRRCVRPQEESASESRAAPCLVH